MRIRYALCCAATVLLTASTSDCIGEAPIDYATQTYVWRVYSHSMRSSNGAAHGSGVHKDWAWEAWRQCNLTVFVGLENTDPLQIRDQTSGLYMGERADKAAAGNWALMRNHQKLSQTAEDNRGADAFYTFRITHEGRDEHFTYGHNRENTNLILIVAQDNPDPRHLVLAHELGHVLNLPHVTSQEHLMGDPHVPGQGHTLTWRHPFTNEIDPNSECEAARQVGHTMRYLDSFP